MRDAVMRVSVLGGVLFALGLLVFMFDSPVGDTANGFDLSGSLVPIDQIHSGGPERDGIPAIDEPRFVGADAVSLAASARVLGLVVGGEAKAYPVEILNWHEVVNDEIGGAAATVTYCPLCGTGVAFGAGKQGGRLQFGVSGLLYNNDVLLYDRETESLWSQLLAKAISGPLKGNRLQPLPLLHTSWEAWRNAHPDTLVLSRDTGFSRDYDRDPYAGYAQQDAVYFPMRAQSARYHPKERVLGIEIDGRFKAYPVAELSRHDKREFTDQFAGQTLTIRFDSQGRSASAFDPVGRMLPAVNAFWFAWYAFHPETEVFTAE